MDELENNKAFYRLESAIYQYYQFDDPRREQALSKIRDHSRQAQLKLLDELQQDPTLDATIVAQYRKTLQGRWREFEKAWPLDIAWDKCRWWRTMRLTN
ncbi:MAG: hypothetical protein DYG89_20100 [Caldilinea sp. CFX5]|nr:hypothetical protein [Caldilinea sp. CFX5]